MVNVTYEENKKVNEYPKTMISSDGAVILFTSLGVGACIAPSKSIPMGDHSKCWDVSRFTDFYGIVTIKSER